MYVPNSIIIVLILLTLYAYNVKLDHPSYGITIYDHVKDRVKSGDMILFTSLDNYNQLLMGSYITHIGLIYRKDANSRPMFVESFNYATMPFYPKRFSSGIAICDLEHRINTYRGFVLYKELQYPISEQANNDFWDFIQYALENMKYDPSVASNEMRKIIFNEPFTNETNCGQFTTLMLLKLGLIDFWHFYNRRKHHLIWTSKLKYLINNSYKTPVYIYSQYFSIPNPEEF